MSDQRARSLGRETGVEAEAALLRERMRAGELSQAHVALAAHLGAEAAQEVLAIEPTPLSWVHALERLGLEATVRALIACSRVQGVRWRGSPQGFAAEAWVLCPCARHVEQCEDLPYPQGQGLWLSPLRDCVGAVVTGRNDTALALLRQSLGRGSSARASHADRRHPMTSLVATDLVPWVLGQGDPVRARHLREHVTHVPLPYLRRRVALARAAGDEAEQARCLAHAAWSQLALGVGHDTQREFVVVSSREAVDCLRREAPSELPGDFLSDFLGLALAAEPLVYRARDEAGASLDALREAGRLLEASDAPDFRGRAQEVLSYLSELCRREGAREEAAEVALRSIRAGEASGAGALVAWAQYPVLAGLALEDGDPRAARRYAQAGLERARTLRFEREARRLESQLLLVLGRASEGAERGECFAAALEIARACDLPQLAQQARALAEAR